MSSVHLVMFKLLLMSMMVLKYRFSEKVHRYWSKQVMYSLELMMEQKECQPKLRRQACLSSIERQNWTDTREITLSIDCHSGANGTIKHTERMTVKFLT